MALPFVALPLVVFLIVLFIAEEVTIVLLVELVELVAFIIGLFKLFVSARCFNKAEVARKMLIKTIIKARPFWNITYT